MHVDVACFVSLRITQRKEYSCHWKLQKNQELQLPFHRSALFRVTFKIHPENMRNLLFIATVLISVQVVNSFRSILSQKNVRLCQRSNEIKLKAANIDFLPHLDKMSSLMTAYRYE
jgi:hypothetical protein